VLSTFYHHKYLLPDQTSDLVGTIIQFHWSNWWLSSISFISSATVTISNTIRGPWLSWSYGSLIYNYMCNQCLLPLKLWVRTPFVARCTRYNIVIKLVSYLRQVGVFLQVLNFSVPIKLTSTIQLKYCWKYR